VSAAGSPGTKAMFIVDVEAKLLEEDSRRLFHTKTAQLLYLAKSELGQIF
jgi:hypothetical protein